MLHCDLRMRWKVASDLRFRTAISEPKTLLSAGFLAIWLRKTQKSLAIAIVRFWCAKIFGYGLSHPTHRPAPPTPSGESISSRFILSRFRVALLGSLMRSPCDAPQPHACQDKARQPDVPSVSRKGLQSPSPPTEPLNPETPKSALQSL